MFCFHVAAFGPAQWKMWFYGGKCGSIVGNVVLCCESGLEVCIIRAMRGSPFVTDTNCHKLILPCARNSCMRAVLLASWLGNYIVTA